MQAVVCSPYSLAPILLVWMIAQLSALILSSAQFRFWAQFPTHGERLALAQLLVVQILISSLLFPWICRTLQQTLALMIASLPFICLAGYLSASTLRPTLLLFAFVAIWLAGMGLWGKVVISPRAKWLAVTLISSWNILGVLLSYLTLETTGRMPTWSDACPLLAAARMGIDANYTAFSGVFVIGLLGIAAVAIERVNLSTPVIH